MSHQHELALELANQPTNKTNCNSLSFLIRNPLIQITLLSCIVVRLGIWIRNFSILLYVVDVTNGSVTAVTMISLAEFGPAFIFSFIGGTFADRYSSKKMIIGCQLLSTLVKLITIICISLVSWKMIYWSSLLSATLSQFSSPAFMKLFKIHLPDVQQQAAMSIFTSLNSLIIIFGPILGTYFYQFGLNFALGFEFITLLISTLILYFLPEDIPNNELKRISSVVEDMISGVQFVLSKKILICLGLRNIAVGLSKGLTSPLVVFLVTEQLGLPKDNLRWLKFLFGLGLFMGGLTSLEISNVPPQKLLIFGTATCTICIIIYGMSVKLWLNLILEFIFGFIVPINEVSINTLVLKEADERFVGRVNGVITPLFFGTMMISISVCGWLKEIYPLHIIYSLSGGLYFLGVLFLLPLYNLAIVD